MDDGHLLPYKETRAYAAPSPILENDHRADCLLLARRVCLLLIHLRILIMSDDLKDRGPQDRSRVDVNEDWELKYWSERFGVDKSDLEHAVESVGPMVSDIEAYFNKTLDIRALHGNRAHSD